MIFKHGLLLVGAAVIVTGCGGSGSGDNGSPSSPYVEFRVNGVINPTEVTSTWVEADVGSSSLDICSTAAYDNAQLVIDGEPDYCANSITNISFSVRYTNPTYEPIQVNYDGLGMEVRIFQYDDAALDLKGPEVWNSSYSVQSQVLGLKAAGATVDDFDPNKPNNVELLPSYSIPSESGFISVSFDGHRIFPEGMGEYEDFSASEIEANIGATAYPSTQSCDYVLQANDAGNKYRYVKCYGEELLPEPGAGTTEPVKFVASVTFSFNDWTDQPEDIIITLNPPE